MSFPPPTPKQARVLWFALTALALAVVVAITGLVLWGFGWVLHRLSGVLIPVAFALVLAYILDPVVGYFERKKIPRLWSVILVYVLGLLTVAAALGSVLPDLMSESQKLVAELPDNVENLRAKAEHFIQDSSWGKQLPASWRKPLLPGGKLSNEPAPAVTNSDPESAKLAPNTITTTNGPAVADKSSSELPLNESVIPGLTTALVVMAKWLTNQLSRMTTWVEFLIGFVLVPVYLFYFLLEKDGITRRWTDYLPIKDSKVKKELVFILNAINECLIVFFRGQVLVALCVGVLLTIAYLIMGLNYAVLLGMTAAVLGIMPYLGTIVTLLLALAVAGVQFGDWTHPLIVLGIAATVKLLEDFLISPKIIGERAGLHPLTIILAVMVGTTLLGGFIGALLAIPLTAALRTLMYRYIWTKDHPGTTPKDATEFFRLPK